ncbi:putative metal-dependent hydrolase [Lachnospiraceae bacterium PM6-15]|uniref:M48 family metallopeptidase n=1 Tax=Ohessyouella blattaphilus TaxID=2949333 RepID=UPI0025628463|nr:M48 family metallopeptidase [Lachnospiraceae bacterium OttesenSCG-928-J05]
MWSLFLRRDKIKIQIERRRIKNINIYIRPPKGEVLVTAPLGASDEEIEAVLKEKQDWIRKSREKVIARSQKTIEEPALSKEELQKLAKKVEVYADKWEPVLGVKATSFTLRRMKTRWGSCSISSKRIRINTKLAYYPDRCLEYVVVHELCHLLEAGHNKKFWGQVEKALPDYKETIKLLKE